MLSDFGIVQNGWSRWTALVFAAGFVACVDDRVTSAPEAALPAEPLRVFGFVELTFSGIGTREFASSLIVAPTMEALEVRRAQRGRSGDLRDLVTQDLTIPDNSGGGANGTIQLAQPQRSEFVLDSVRYLRASFDVRNAQVDGTGYDTPRSNLIFLAVGTSSAINQTAVSRLELAGGTPAPPALALQVLPTARVESMGDSLIVPDPDVVQLLSEAEVATVAAIAPAAVIDVFPYGFVVRNSNSSTTRTLPASPAVGQFDGVIDFAFRVPEEAETLSVLMLAVDDSDTRLTQSLEQQTTAARDSLLARATALTANTITLLPGGSLPGVFGLRTLCSVRTAGAAGAAMAHLVNVDWTFDSFTPNPSATDGSASHTPSSASFQATFSAAPDGFGPESFTVRGLQSGPAFLGEDYSLNGTTISTPQRPFFPGEEIEVALTNALSCPQPQTARYRVEAGAGTGTFGPDSTYDTGDGPLRLALGDLNGNGVLDIVVANSSAANVSVLLGNSDGSFQAQQTFPAGTEVTAVALGDVDGDGVLDAITSNWGSDDVSVLLGNGDGSFQAQQTFGVGSQPQGMAVGDLNGNGILDIVVANSNSANVTVLLGNGDGTFQPQPALAVGSQPQSVALGDLDGNGILDSVVALLDADSVAVLLGNGDGTFQGPQQIPVAGGPISIAPGDVTGNGVLDAVTANLGTGDASVLVGNGNGTFQPEQTHGTGESPRSVALGDLTGNGVLDLVVSKSELADEAISVLIGEGGGTFQPQNPVPAGSGSRGVVLGDLNGDGVLDVVVANLADDNVSVLLGQTP